MATKVANGAMLRQIQRAYPQIYFACHVRHVRSQTTPGAVSDRDAAILGHLDEGAPMSGSSLARHMGIGLSTVTEAIDDLEARGLVTRRRSSRDRRAVELRITPRGIRAMQASSVLDTRRLAAVLDRLSPAERADVALGLSLLARAARELIESDPTHEETP
jgi:DNA-binding MarR family transcriptional regulator